MEKKHLALLLALAFVVLAGCTTSAKGCCTKAEAFADEGAVASCTSPSGATAAPFGYGNAKMPSMRTELRCCVLPDGTQSGAHPDECPVDDEKGYCKAAYWRCEDSVRVGGSCNAGERPAYPNGQFLPDDVNADLEIAMQSEAIPVCIDNKPNPCVQEQCRVQLCGADAQTNMPLMSAQDAADSLERELFAAETAQAARDELRESHNAEFSEEEWGKIIGIAGVEGRAGVEPIAAGEYAIVKDDDVGKYRVVRGEDGFTVYALRETADPDKLDLSASASASSAINLYGATCSVLPTNAQTLNRVKKAGGSLWANTFRLGIGSTFSDYEESRLYFPLSDRFCGLPTGGTKDRYMNYKLPFGEDEACVLPQTINALPDLYMCQGHLERYSRLDACEAACDNACTAGRPGWARWICESTGVAYSYDVPDQAACNANCEENCVLAQPIRVLPDLYICPGTPDRYSTRTACEANCGQACTSGRPGWQRAVCTRTGVAYGIEGSAQPDWETCRANCHDAPADYMLACAASREENDYPYESNTFLSEKGNYAVTEREYLAGIACDSTNYAGEGHVSCGSGHNDEYGKEGNDNGNWIYPSGMDGAGYTDAKELNKKYYGEYFSTSEYFSNQLQNGYEDAVGNAYDGTEYECKSGSECMSGSCSAQREGTRSTCIGPDGEDVDCGCAVDTSDYTRKVKCGAVDSEGEALASYSLTVEYACADANGNTFACSCDIKVPEYEGQEENAHCVEGTCPQDSFCDTGNGRTYLTEYYRDYVYSTFGDPWDPMYYDGIVGYNKDGDGRALLTVRRDVQNWASHSRPFEWVEEEGVGRYRALIKWEDAGSAKLIQECDVEQQYIEITVNYIGNDLSGRRMYDDAQVDVFPHEGAIGKCQLDEFGEGLEVGTYGWCDPCTLSTIAVQRISTAPDLYCPLYSATKIAADYTREELPADSAETLSTTRDGTTYTEILRSNMCRGDGSWARCTAPGAGSDRGSWLFNDREIQCRPNQAGEYWPVLDPNEVYLHEKLNTYLSSNVMPVLDVRDNHDANGRAYPQTNGAGEIAYHPGYREEQVIVYVRDGYGDIVHDGEGNPVVDEEQSYSYIVTTVDDYTTYLTAFLHNRGAIVLVIANAEDFTDDASGFWAIANNNKYQFQCGVGGQPACTNPGYNLLVETNDYWVRGSLGGDIETQGRVLTKKEYYLLKARVLKDKCPSCLIAVAVGNRGQYVGYLADIDDEVSPNMNNPLDKIFQPARNIIGMDWVSNEVYADYIDLIANDWQISAAQSLDPQAEVDAQVDYAGKLIRKYHKPILTWGLQIIATSEDEHDHAQYSAMAGEIFGRQRDLTSVGIMGVVYRNWDSGWAGLAMQDNVEGKRGDGSWAKWDTNNDGVVDAHYYSGDFCALEEASKKLAGVSEITFYQKLYAQESCECIECTQEEVRAGLCGYAASLLSTPGVEGEMCLIPGVQNPSVSDFANYRASGSCITNSCSKCSESGESAVCSRTTDGKKEGMGSVRISGLADSDNDIIAVLPQQIKCCLEDDNGNYTYVAYDGMLQKNEQILYHKSGLLTFDCGKSPDLRPSVCGNLLSVENAKVTCSTGGVQEVHLCGGRRYNPALQLCCTNTMCNSNSQKCCEGIDACFAQDYNCAREQGDVNLQIFYPGEYGSDMCEANAGESCEIAVEVDNLGTDEARNVRVEAQVGDPGMGEDYPMASATPQASTIESVPGRGNEEFGHVQFTLTAQCPQGLAEDSYYPIRVVADPQDSIGETIEYDNAWTFYVGCYAAG